MRNLPARKRAQPVGLPRPSRGSHARLEIRLARNSTVEIEAVLRCHQLCPATVVY